jgi:hypothetical protein
LLFLLASGFWLLASPSPAPAQPTQEEVFQSIKDNVGPSQTDYSKLLPYFLAGLGLVILLVLVSQRKRQETATPKPLNHQGKLLREVLKTVPLRAAELKQLRMLADAREERLASPLTLLLCPSLLAEAVHVRQAQGGKGKGKFDRKAVLQLARKVGLVAEKKQK